MDSFKYTNGTTSQSIRAGAGQVAGVIVNSHTSGTMKLWDALTAIGGTLDYTIIWKGNS